MKLTDEQMSALDEAMQSAAASYLEGDDLEGGITIFLAGCAWQQEQDAKLCDKLTEMQWPAFKQFAVAIRAQGDDRG